MKKILTLAIAVLLCGQALFAQTVPSAQSLIYTQDFSSLSSSSTTYTTGFQGWTIGTSSGSAFKTVAPTSNQSLNGSSNASTTNGGVHNYNGKIGILASGSVDPSLAFVVNTTGFTTVKVTFDIMTIRNPYDGSSNTRRNNVELQYRVGSSVGTFTSASGSIYRNNTTTQTGSVTTPQNSKTITVTLPSGCDNQSALQLRWVQRDSSGSGSRPSFAFDNICVSGTSTITVGGSTTFCQGGSVSLTAISGSSWLWSTGATTQSITATTSGTYSVTTTKATGCSSTSSPVTVTVNSFNGPLTVFTESMGNVSSTTSISTHESNNGFDNISYLMTGTADVRNTSASSGYSGASGGANIFFTSTSSVNFQIENINTTGKSSLQLSFGIFKSTTASDGSGMIIEVSSDGSSYSPLSFPALPTGSGTAVWYYLTASGNMPAISDLRIRFRQTDNTTSFRIDDVSLTTPIITGVSALCSGSNATLTANGGSTYSWSTGATTSVITISPTVTTTYSVTATNSTGCTATATTTVTVNALPTPSISGVTSLCSGSSATLTASGGSTYSWNTGATTTSITVSPTVSTTYTVIAANAYGCTATATHNIIVPIDLGNGNSSPYDITVIDTNIWFKFTAQKSILTVMTGASLNANDTPTVSLKNISLYSGSCGSLSLISSTGEIPSGTANPSFFINTLDSGTTYYLRFTSRQASGFISIALKFAYSLSTELFGQNAWYINNADINNDPGVNFPWSDVDISDVKYIRLGGAVANYQPLYTWDPVTFAVGHNDVPKLINLINEARTNHIEPIIQVSFISQDATQGCPIANYPTDAQQAIIAGNLVKQIDLEYPDPYIPALATSKIKYWIIGNEPSLTKNCTGNPYYGGFKWDGTTNGVIPDAQRIATYIRDFSIHMKDKDKSIQIIAPELTSFSNKTSSLINQMVDNLISDPSHAYSIMGKITTGESSNAAGQYYIDVLSFHTYPNFTVTATERQDVIDDPNGATNDGSFRNTLTTSAIGRKGYIDMITDITDNTQRDFNNIKVACDEYNLVSTDPTFSDDPSSGTFSQLIHGSGNRSFLAGQWNAEMLSEAMNISPWIQFMNPWSAQEGANCFGGKTVGYIGSSLCTSVKRPSYYHYQMVASIGEPSANFQKNTYTRAAPISNIKAFAIEQFSRGSNVGVMIMNQNNAAIGAKSFSVRFETTPSNTGAYYQISIPSAEYTSYISTGPINHWMWDDQISPEQTIFIGFSCSGEVEYTEKYSVTDAANNVDPTTSPNFTTYTVSVSCRGARIGQVKNEEVTNEQIPAFVWTSPNPAINQTAIYYNLGQSSAVNQKADAPQGEIVITNIYGAVIFKYKVTGNANKIDVDCSKFSNGIYFNSLIVDGKKIGTAKMVIAK